ncbi:hypothetical protein BDK51DRAFT_20711 [Blyttiomyces helicus]|uniref:E3 ubiquitin ligase complex SCF subunit n=1 Tax=Blyttiomyces helicus TaxID=388810 RepID=A0A4P9WK96_9FUNG|nr:hypothetical protein BDK51DRAFT_20711 [Blyttiomyces helicus]|eukprot:RKO91988.1 hypothetical protein BDK51DRAFT_20711 [Blyttiomyces helicus]
MFHRANLRNNSKNGRSQVGQNRNSKKKPVAKLTLITEDNESFTVCKKVAEMSMFFKNMLQDTEGIPAPFIVPNVSGYDLKKIIEYCSYHCLDTDCPNDNDSLRSRRDRKIGHWDETFVRNIINKDGDPVIDNLVGLTKAAYFLDIPGLIWLMTKSIANTIDPKPIAEIREIFNVPVPSEREEEILQR